MPLKLPYLSPRFWIASGIAIAKPALDLLSERLEEASRATEKCTDPNSPKHNRRPISELIENHGRFETAILCAAVENVACVFFVRHHGVRGAIERTLPMLGERAQDTFDAAYDHLLDKFHTFVENAVTSLDIDNPTGVPTTTPGKVFCTVEEPSGVVATSVGTGLHYALDNRYARSTAKFVKALPGRVVTGAVRTIFRICSPCIGLVDRLQESSDVVAYFWRRSLQVFYLGLIAVSVALAFCSVYTVYEKLDTNTKSNTGVYNGIVNNDIGLEVGDNDDGDRKRILLVFFLGFVAVSITLVLCSVHAIFEKFDAVAQGPVMDVNSGCIKYDNDTSDITADELSSSDKDGDDTIVEDILPDIEIKIKESSQTPATQFFCFVQPYYESPEDRNISESESEDDQPRIPSALKGKQKEIAVGEDTMAFLGVEDSEKAFMAVSERGSTHDLKDFLHDLNDRYQKNLLKVYDSSSSTTPCTPGISVNEGPSFGTNTSIECTSDLKDACVSFAYSDSVSLCSGEESMLVADKTSAAGAKVVAEPTTLNHVPSKEPVRNMKTSDNSTLPIVKKEECVYLERVEEEMSSSGSSESCADPHTLALRTVLERLKGEVAAHSARVDEMSMMVDASLSDDTFATRFKSTLTPHALPFVPRGLNPSPQSEDTPPSPSPIPLFALARRVPVTLEAPRRRRTQSSGRRKANNNQHQPYKLNGLPLRPFNRPSNDCSPTRS